MSFNSLFITIIALLAGPSSAFKQTSYFWPSSIIPKIIKLLNHLIKIPQQTTSPQYYLQSPRIKPIFFYLHYSNCQTIQIVLHKHTIYSILLLPQPHRILNPFLFLFTIPLILLNSSYSSNPKHLSLLLQSNKIYFNIASKYKFLLNIGICMQQYCL